MKKKTVGIIIAVVLVIAAALIWFFFGRGTAGGNSDDKVYVQSVKDIVSMSGLGIASSYSGVVESQESWDVNRDADKEIKEVFVEVGDTVEEGAPLFTYDTEKLEQQIAQAKLNIEEIENDINNYNVQIRELQEEKDKAAEENKFEYTNQIQTLQMTVKQREFDKKGAQAEIDNYQKGIDNATVVSKISGVVKSINENGYDSMGNAAAYMSIMQTGEYRVKGTIDEQNYNVLSVGQPVILRSRVDETITWTGSIAEIDTENPESNNNGMDFEGGGESATKYPFYITLDSAEGLILGQHVFIEPDYGQSGYGEKEGLWLDASYIVMDDGDPYVWAANGKNRLEKRKVELGEFDDMMYQYEILSGITPEDYITWPMMGLYEGVTTVTDESEVDYNSPLYNQDIGDDGLTGDDMWDDNMMEDGMMNDGMMEDGMTNDGMMEDGMTNDGMMEDGMTNDGMMEDGMTNDGMMEDGNMPENMDDFGDGASAEPMEVME